MLRCHYQTGQFNQPSQLQTLITNVRRHEAARLKVLHPPAPLTPPNPP